MATSNSCVSPSMQSEGVQDAKIDASAFGSRLERLRRPLHRRIRRERKVAHPQSRRAISCFSWGGKYENALRSAEEAKNSSSSRSTQASTAPKRRREQRFAPRRKESSQKIAQTAVGHAAMIGSSTKRSPHHRSPHRARRPITRRPITRRLITPDASSLGRVSVIDRPECTKTGAANRRGAADAAARRAHNLEASHRVAHAEEYRLPVIASRSAATPRTSSSRETTCSLEALEEPRCTVARFHHDRMEIAQEVARQREQDMNRPADVREVRYADRMTSRLNPTTRPSLQIRQGARAHRHQVSKRLRPPNSLENTRRRRLFECRPVDSPFNQGSQSAERRAQDATSTVSAPRRLAEDLVAQSKRRLGSENREAMRTCLFSIHAASSG